MNLSDQLQAMAKEQTALRMEVKSLKRMLALIGTILAIAIPLSTQLLDSSIRSRAQEISAQGDQVLRGEHRADVQELRKCCGG